MLEPDEWLMEQVAKGKSECLEPLVRRYANRLLTFIQRMVGDCHRSEELFQEVFLAVWRKRSQYQAPRPFKAWLFAIALNKCREAFRLRSTTVMPLDAVPAETVAAPDVSPAEAAIATENAAVVCSAVARLPLQQRTVVVLRIWEGLPYGEIANLLGRNEATVRSHMHHGLAAMRRYLEPRLGN